MARKTYVTVVLPWPDTKLQPNTRDGRHWGGANKSRERAIEAGFALTCEAMQIQRYQKPPLGARYRVTLVMRYPDNRRRDVQNIFGAMKAVFDGCAKALGVDDSVFDWTLFHGRNAKGGEIVALFDEWEGYVD